MRRIALALSAALVAAAGSALVPAATSASPPPSPAVEPASVPGELLVGYRQGASSAERSSARNQAGARLVERVVRAEDGRAEVERVAVPAAERAQAIQRLERDPSVAYAEPNWIVTHQATSDDALYTDGSLWGMYGDASTPRNAYGSQAAEAWSGNTGSDTVVVGVIDEGIDTSHPDLAANIWVNADEATGQSGEDDDGNGYVDDVNGWDFAGGDATVYDGDDDHGTHVAGTIAGIGGNRIGVAGMAWNAELVSAKFLGPNGGTTADAVRAIDYLTDLKTRHGVPVVASNNSWGGGGYSQTLYDAIARANGADILFVAAAGNGGSDRVGDDNDRVAHYPSSYALPNVIAVASITSTGGRSSFSNYGARSVDLGAPGSGIWSTLPGGGYGSYNGTSMATPHVTGAAALAAAVTPGMPAAEIRAAILRSAAPTPSLSGKTTTGGRLDVSTFRSPLALRGNTAPATTADTYTVAQDTRLSVGAPGVLANDTDVDGDSLTASLASGPSTGTLTLNADGSFAYTPARGFVGTATFAYTAADELGATSGPATATITVTRTTKTKGKPTAQGSAR